MQEQAKWLKAVYQHWCRKKGLQEAVVVLDRGWERGSDTGWGYEIWVHLGCDFGVQNALFGVIRPA